jgi:hypothetical protein
MQDCNNDTFAEEEENRIEMQGLISGVENSQLKESVARDPSPSPDGGRKAWTAGEHCVLSTSGTIQI